MRRSRGWLSPSVVAAAIAIGMPQPASGHTYVNPKDDPRNSAATK